MRSYDMVVLKLKIIKVTAQLHQGELYRGSRAS